VSEAGEIDRRADHEAALREGDVMSVEKRAICLEIVEMVAGQGGASLTTALRIPKTSESGDGRRPEKTESGMPLLALLLPVEGSLLRPYNLGLRASMWIVVLAGSMLVAFLLPSKSPNCEHFSTTVSPPLQIVFTLQPSRLSSLSPSTASPKLTPYLLFSNL